VLGTWAFQGLGSVLGAPKEMKGQGFGVCGLGFFVVWTRFEFYWVIHCCGCGMSTVICSQFLPQSRVTCEDHLC